MSGGRFQSPAGQCGGAFARAGSSRRAARRRHRPNVGTRSGERLFAGRLDAGSVGAPARNRATGGCARRAPFHRAARAGHARFPPHGRADARLRQQHPPGRQRRRPGRCLRLPGFRAGLYSPTVLPRHRAVPLGCAVRRSGGHLSYRRQGEAGAARQRVTPPLARHGARAHSLSGIACAHLLGRGWASVICSDSRSTRWSRAARYRRRS